MEKTGYVLEQFLNHILQSAEVDIATLPRGGAIDRRPSRTADSDHLNVLSPCLM